MTTETQQGYYIELQFFRTNEANQMREFNPDLGGLFKGFPLSKTRKN